MGVISLWWRWSLATTGKLKNGLPVVATAGTRALCENNLDRGAHEFARGKLQAAHAALEKLDRMSHVHFTNPEVLASLRIEIDPDNAATAFEERARGAETWLSIRKRFCS